MKAVMDIHASATAGHLRYHLKLKIYSAHTFRTYGKNYTANMNNTMIF
jgi:hypothetical protein